MTACLELLRHGDTGQRGFRGQIDDALSDAGWTQMRGAVVDGRWDAIVSSPLQRCAAFAGELAAQHGLPLRLDPRWAEYHFGDWQDIAVETLAQEQGTALAAFWADPVAHPPPGGEAFAAFEARLLAACDAIAREHAHQRVLVVTHGGPIRLLQCRAQGRDSREMASIEVPHASLHAMHWPAAMAIASASASEDA